MDFCKYLRIGPIYFYVSTRRLKRRQKYDAVIRNQHKKLQRIKREKWMANDGRCEECGQRFRIEDMQLHHIVPLSKNPALAVSISKLQLVCPDCHNRLHGRPVASKTEEKEQ